MWSLKRVFEKIRKDNPSWSDYVCFSSAISGKGFSRKTISWHFNKLVAADDYSRKDKKEILEWLFRFSQDQKHS